MNEITTFSDELKIHGAKIKMSKNRIGQEIIEIGRELAEAKEKCKHGEWLLFLEQECEFSQQQANKFLKCFKEMPNYQLTSNLGIEAMYFLTTLTDEQKEQQHELTTGTKTIYEMNQQEVNELKKQLDQAKKSEEAAKRSEEIALKRLEAAENKAPEVIEKVVTIVPDNVKESLKEKDNFLKAMKKEAEQLQEEIKALKLHQTDTDVEADQAEKKLKKLEREASIEVLEIAVNIQNFLKSTALSSFQLGAIAHSNEKSKARIKEAVTMLENFIINVNAAINGRKQI